MEDFYCTCYSQKNLFSFELIRILLLTLNLQINEAKFQDLLVDWYDFYDSIRKLKKTCYYINIDELLVF